MTLTVKEKEHWKTSIDRKVQRAIDAIYEEGGSGFRKRIQTESRQKALQSLQIEELIGRQKAIDKQLDTLRDERQTVQNKIVEMIKTHCPEYTEKSDYHFNSEAAITLRQSRFERELLSREEQGRRILRLREEQEELLDTVWLATSSVQIKELWSRVSRILNQTPTSLQQETLNAVGNATVEE